MFLFPSFLNLKESMDELHAAYRPEHEDRYVILLVLSFYVKFILRLWIPLDLLHFIAISFKV